MNELTNVLVKKGELGVCENLVRKSFDALEDWHAVLVLSNLGETAHNGNHKINAAKLFYKCLGNMEEEEEDEVKLSHVALIHLRLSFCIFRTGGVDKARLLPSKCFDIYSELKLRLKGNLNSIVRIRETSAIRH